MPADEPLRPSFRLGPPQDNERLVYALFAFLAVVVAVTMVVVISSIGSESSRAGAEASEAQGPPYYWTVRSGDSYSKIAAKSDLTVAELETFNPRVNPATLVPGQRIKLRRRVPPPPPKPKGPRFWTVRSGQTLASISAKSGHSIPRLIQLNPKLKPTTLQPGDRVRLRK